MKPLTQKQWERKQRKAQKRADKVEKKEQRKERRTQRRAEGKGFWQVTKKIGITLGLGAVSVVANKLGISSVFQTITKQFTTMKIGKAITGSPKTTVSGIAGFIALLATQAGFMLDGDPLTIVNWTVVINAFIVLIMGFIMKDGDVSSKSIGLDEK